MHLLAPTPVGGWVSQWVIDIFRFGDRYHISELGELVWRRAIVGKLITGAADNHFPSLSRVALSREQKELPEIRWSQSNQIFGFLWDFCSVKCFGFVGEIVWIFLQDSEVFPTPLIIQKTFFAVWSPYLLTYIWVAEGTYSSVKHAPSGLFAGLLSHLLSSCCWGKGCWVLSLSWKLGRRNSDRDGLLVLQHQSNDGFWRRLCFLLPLKLIPRWDLDWVAVGLSSQWAQLPGQQWHLRILVDVCNRSWKRRALVLGF